MERGRREGESAWVTGQEPGGREGQRKSERAWVSGVKSNGGNGEEADSMNHYSWGPTRCNTLMLCAWSPVPLENWLFLAPLAWHLALDTGSCWPPSYRRSIKVTEKTGVKTLSGFNPARFLRWMCGYMWLYRLPPCLLRSISRTTTSAQQLTKGLQGALEKCLPWKNTLGTAIKRKELCYLGRGDASTGGHAPLLLFQKYTQRSWLRCAGTQGWVPAPSSRSIRTAASSW